MTPASKLGRKKATPLPQSPIDIDSPIRAIACLKKVDDMKRFEENEDCFILGFDPSDSVMLSCDDDSPTTSSVRSQDVDDLCFVAEKGKVGPVQLTSICFHSIEFCVQKVLILTETHFATLLKSIGIQYLKN